jgi:glycosyltransferase involved in cell wall biosynthesis
MRLTRRKRSLELLETLRRLRAETRDDLSISAYIIGEGPQRGAMERFIARHDMTGWVSLAGRSTHGEIREAFRRTDVFVAPAIQESFGIAALEARAAGIPVVAMDRSGIREFIEHGRDGLLVPDDDGMLTALKVLVTQPSIRAAIADHNARVPISFGWHEALGATSVAYERAAALQRTHADTRPRGQATSPAIRLSVGQAAAYRDVPA